MIKNPVVGFGVVGIKTEIKSSEAAVQQVLGASLVMRPMQ